MNIPSMLVAYDVDGNVTHTLDYIVQRDPVTGAVGLVDFMAHEASGGEMTEVWIAAGAKGSKVWPEWLGVRAHDFRVELAGDSGAKRISALVHRTSGLRRERRDIEKAIAERTAETPSGQPVDLRDIVGGPDQPIALDATGATAVTVDAPPPPPNLPLLGLRQP